MKQLFISQTKQSFIANALKPKSMKRKLQSMLAIIFLTSGLATVKAQSTAVWALTADQSVAVTGTGITASPQSLSVLSINGYTGIAGPLAPATSQRTRVSAGWPQNTAYVANRYCDYSVTVTSGTFNSVKVTVPLAAAATNNLRADVFYSTNAFATSTQLNVVSGTPTPIVLTQGAGTFQSLVYNFDIALPVGTTFSVRVFPWYTASDGSTSRYLLSQDVQIALYTTSLPLKLTAFNSSVADNKTKLSWVTSNEINVLKYDVEKSIDAKEFNAIASVKANNSASDNQYVYTDETPLIRKAFYRLKMIDKDGSFTYSNVLAVSSKSAIKVSVYPNPVIDNIAISHPKASNKAIIKIISIDGKVLNQMKVEQSTTQSSFSTGNLTRGTYTVQFTDEDLNSTTQFIKK